MYFSFFNIEFRWRLISSSVFCKVNLFATLIFNGLKRQSFLIELHSHLILTRELKFVFSCNLLKELFVEVEIAFSFFFGFFLFSGVESWFDLWLWLSFHLDFQVCNCGELRLRTGNLSWTRIKTKTAFHVARGSLQASHLPYKLWVGLTWVIF